MTNDLVTVFGPYECFPHVYLSYSGENPSLKRVFRKEGRINEETLCEVATGFEILHEIIPGSSPEAEAYYIHAKI